MGALGRGPGKPSPVGQFIIPAHQLVILATAGIQGGWEGESCSPRACPQPRSPWQLALFEPAGPHMASHLCRGAPCGRPGAGTRQTITGRPIHHSRPPFVIPAPAGIHAPSLRPRTSIAIPPTTTTRIPQNPASQSAIPATSSPYPIRRPTPQPAAPITPGYLHLAEPYIAAL